MGENNGLKGAVSRAALREAAQVSANLSATVPESASTDARPEQEAAERVKSGAVDTALTTGDLSLGAARAAYLRIKTMREKTLERKTAGPTDGGTHEKENPAVSRDKPRPSKASVSQPRRSAKTGCAVSFSRKGQWKDRLKERACEIPRRQCCRIRLHALTTGSRRVSARCSGRQQCGGDSLRGPGRQASALCRGPLSSGTASGQCAPGCSLPRAGP